MVVDGEIVIMKNGKVDFHSLQEGGHLISGKEIDRLRNYSPATYIIFDILEKYLAKYRKRKGPLFRTSSELERKLTKKALRKSKDKIAQRQIELRATHDISAGN